MAAYLYIEESTKGIPLKSVSYGFHQEVSYENGYPNSSVRGGRINFQLKSSKDCSFYHWAKGDDITKKGKIELTNKATGDNVFKTIDFTGAFVISYQEMAGEGDGIESLEISCKTIKIDDDTFTNPNWGDEDEEQKA